jgi:hypothetical protein
LDSGVSGQGLRSWARSVLDALLCLHLLLIANGLLGDGVVFFGGCGGLRLLLVEQLLVELRLCRRRYDRGWLIPRGGLLGGKPAGGTPLGARLAGRRLLRLLGRGSRGLLT